MTETVFVSALVGIGVTLLFSWLASVERRLGRISRLEAKVDALLKQAGVNFDPYHDVPPDVREALDGGHRILAIKRFREATGADLKEAKEFVDEVRRRKLAAS